MTTEMPSLRKDSESREASLDNLGWPTVLLIAGLVFALTPLGVFLHEVAHASVLTLGGIPARVTALGDSGPIGFDWDFAGLRAAQARFATSAASSASL